MAVTYNVKGTSVSYFTIGKKGTTLYQGTADPSGSYTIANGDFWFDTTDNSLKIRVSGAWEAISLANFEFSGNTISSKNTDGNIVLDPNGTGIVSVQGNMTVTGDCSADNFVDTSSRRYKADIQDLDKDKRRKFDLLRPVTYTWSKVERKGQKDFGFIAEEMDKIYPELVVKDDEGNCTGLNYGKLTAILTAHAQEQDEEIKYLNDQNIALKKEIAQCNAEMCQMKVALDKLMAEVQNLKNR